MTPVNILSSIWKCRPPRGYFFTNGRINYPPRGTSTLIVPRGSDGHHVANFFRSLSVVPYGTSMNYDEFMCFRAFALFMSGSYEG